jgi:hypothetical protein
MIGYAGRTVSVSPRTRLASEPAKRVIWVVALLVALAPVFGEARPDLKTVRSKHYVLHSDLEDSMIADLGTRMDAMFAEY